MPVSLWAAAEVSAGLMVCCLPVLSRLFRRPAVKSSSGHGTRSADAPFSKGKKYRELDESLLQSNLNDAQIDTSASRFTPPASAHLPEPEENAPSPNIGDIEKGLQLLKLPHHKKEFPKPEIIRTVSVSQDTAFQISEASENLTS